MNKEEQIIHFTAEVLKHKYNNDPDRLDEAMEAAEEMYSTFGMFVGFYNRVNKTSWTVEKAWDNEDLRQLFVGTAKAMAGGSAPIKPKTEYPTEYKRTKSTKNMSYSQLKKSSVAYKVITAIMEAPIPVSRNEIADLTGLRLSSVTGQCTPLIEMGIIKPIGRKYDHETDRMVETLTVDKEKLQ